jgi:hypothetical protein
LVQTNQEVDAGIHIATFIAKLTYYPSVTNVEIGFFITITPCTGVEITQVTGQPNYDYYYYSIYGSTFEIPYPLFSITPSCDVIVSVNPDLTNAVSFGSCLNDNVGISL